MESKDLRFPTPGALLYPLFSAERVGTLIGLRTYPYLRIRVAPVSRPDVLAASTPPESVCAPQAQTTAGLEVGATCIRISSKGYTIPEECSNG